MIEKKEVVKALCEYLYHLTKEAEGYETKPQDILDYSEAIKNISHAAVEISLNLN